MCAVYAFMRECDDRSDEAGATETGLVSWREQMDLALDGEAPEHPLWPAFADTVNRYCIPRAYLYDMIEGVTSDLSFSQPKDFDELYRYCYRVAGVVGLTITHIFGYQNPETLAMAEKCGIAFQLTNIIRDVGEDTRLGRCYLPLDLMARYGVSSADLAGRTVTSPVRSLLEDLGGRARAFYDYSRPMIGQVGRDSQSSLWALIEIYSRLFARIEGADYEVLARRHRLPTWEKLSIMARAMLR